MAHRTVLTERQRAALFDLPTDEASLLKHYTLDDEDIEHIHTRRRPENQIGFALQLCAFRYPGRLLKAGEVIPEPVLRFIAAQIGLKPDDLLPYATRENTRYEHLDALRRIYGYKMFTGKPAKQMKCWLDQYAEAAQSSEGMVRGFVEECRRRQIVLPGPSRIERHCADALVAADQRVDARIVSHLDRKMRSCLDSLLSEEVEGRTSRFIWLRQFEVGKNSADINRQLDRLEFLQRIALSPEILDNIPAHRVSRLRRQGERYFTDGLRDITSDRRLAILATCVVEWSAAIADIVVETHDRIVGSVWREAKKICDTRVAEAQPEIAATLAGFETLGTTLLMAKGDEVAVAGAVDASCGWGVLENLVATAGALGKTVKADALAYVEKGYHRFKLYAPRMLAALEITGASVAEPLLSAGDVIRDKRDIPSRSAPFLQPRSKWRGHLRNPETNRDRLWVVAVLFHLREAFRPGDVWLANSRRYSDIKQAMVPVGAAQTMGLSMPLEPETWIEDRKRHLEAGLNRLALAVRNGTLPGRIIEDGRLRVERLEADVPTEADSLILDLYRRLPEVRITDILMDVDNDTGFTDAFTHVRTGAPCKDRLGLLNVVLAEGLNLGLSKMAAASSTHSFIQLARLSNWHVESEAINQALATVIEAQAQLRMSRYWGAGETASSDGQFFPTTRQGEAMNLINAKYGHEPGLKAYTHVSDQYGPFATQVIPATVNEAPYILDGLLMNPTGKRIREQYADTGGFTDIVFAATSLLGYRFIPRIRDLPSKRLHVFDRRSVPNELKGLVGDKIRENTIIANWPDVLRCIATMLSGRMQPSQLLKKLAARPRQHDLAIALREIGRIERTLFIIEWLLDTDMQRRANIGLNKGEAHHALKNALRLGRQGEIRDRTTEGQHFRIAGLNLLTAIIIYWNTKQLGLAVAARKKAGLDTPEYLLAHISPLGWAHIILTGEYRWRKMNNKGA
ncbi:Tn3 family transposase [Rhodophyticola sp. CCM32]|uniref:Tn3 family transposase n=1 Tax=Rhodophyticola sp. CCM32 TaxID=2916397 RepID=UPI00107EEE59|nr:Tn3 family transposase [Rhodophyticola sp. CCM32]QBY00521.1 Tn3 family transposase [Rhodophyticola sp. CCM32]